MNTRVSGFSKLTKQQKIDWLTATHLNNDNSLKLILENYMNQDENLQGLHDQFAENTLTNYYLPFSVAPNFTINDKDYTIPMVIEESSVVAAASKAAKFWQSRGGFKAKVLGTEKIGQIHLKYTGDATDMVDFFAFAKAQLLESIATLSTSMVKRGGGLRDLVLINKTKQLDGYWQLHGAFETVDAMGANYINSCLETIASTFLSLASNSLPQQPIVVMSILSNYVPNCTVQVEVSCPIEDLGTVNGLSGKEFTNKFITAVDIARVEPYRAVTHNKGIMNGIDAVVLATGNDFRAVEAGAHAYAARDGHYRSLTYAHAHDNIFTFGINIPMALGTVGGLTNLHPLVKVALTVLDNPNAKELMQITATAGLAQNFGAIHSLVTTGIQKGHMKMHLMNILTQQDASPVEKVQLIKYFETHTITVSEVKTQLEKLRNA